MPSECSLNRPVPRWLHIWAILTVIATALLLALGGLVTTFRVGMADPIWPTTPWFLFFTSWSEPRPGFLIEHSHRLAGYVVGCFTIVLTVGMLATARTCGLKKLGILCLFAVIAQGMLGGFRVVLNELMGPNLAIIHGCFAQIVFSLLVAAAVLTATPAGAFNPPQDDRQRYYRIARLLVGIIFLQLIWGALVRHNPSPLVQRLHLITAFAVIGTAVWTIKTAQASPQLWTRLRGASVLLAILLVVQILFGVEAWMGKFASGILPELQKITREQTIIRGIHMLVGTGILATAVVLVLLSRPPVAVVPSEELRTLNFTPAIPAQTTLASSHPLGGSS